MSYIGIQQKSGSIKDYLICTKPYFLNHIHLEYKLGES